MHLPPLTLPDEGFNYGLDLLGHRICTGAKMGLPQYYPRDPDVAIKLRMAKMRMVDGDYAPNGAYFGNVPGSPLYHVESLERVKTDTGDVPAVRLFLRATSRESAKKEVRESLPNATFYR